MHKPRLRLILFCNNNRIDAANAAKETDATVEANMANATDATKRQ